MKSINAVTGMEHFIYHATVYEDVIHLYRNDQILKECPIYIEFAGEMAVDYGGVVEYRETCMQHFGKGLTVFNLKELLF